MIKGIGVDIVEISRIKKAMQTPGFAERFFSVGECEFFNSKTDATNSIAANFAAKEAFSKAIGTGVRGFALKDVEVLRNQQGKPYINLYNHAKTIAESLGIGEIMVSLSHSDENAVAFVTAVSAE